MMNPVELKQLPLLWKNFLKNNNCTDFLVMSAHTYSRFDLIFKSGDTSVVGEYKYRDTPLETFDNSMLEKKKHKALTAASQLLGGTNAKAFYILESGNIILIFDLSKEFNWKEGAFPKTKTDKTLVSKEYTDLNVLAADFILSKKGDKYYRIPNSMLADMFKLRAVEKDIESGSSKYDRATLTGLADTIRERVKKEFRKIQETQ